ncbi:MAG: hypothetical protein JWR74_1177 [Polaromonas sp.]|nr:hypothetical protein [Polaromonas sp.]
MKALTICQPYAALIVRGHKWVENRTWPTAYRGQLIIHAGKSREWLSGDEDQAYRDDPLEFGAVVGEARLADVLHMGHIQRGDYDAKYPWLKAHAHTEGPWCWVLQDIVRYAQPVPYKGAQGLWNFQPVAQAVQ